jgi:hypothetical protein
VALCQEIERSKGSRSTHQERPSLTNRGNILFSNCISSSIHTLHGFPFSRRRIEPTGNFVKSVEFAKKYLDEVDGKLGSSQLSN